MTCIVVEGGTANLKAQAFLGCVRGSILDGESTNYLCVRIVQSNQLVQNVDGRKLHYGKPP